MGLWDMALPIDYIYGEVLSMNLREKLGQQFVFALPEVTHLTAEVADFLVDCNAGGIVLFGYNSQTLAQIAGLIADLQALAANKGMPPFLISLDEEGGFVSRLPAEGQDLIAPSQMALAHAGIAAVQASAAVTARRLRHLGFNLNYAPVSDINNNPANPVIGVRSYGSDAQQVAALSVAAIEAYLQNDISPCVKHFPGHGDTSVDSHYGLPIVEKSLAELRQFELIPFQKAIAAGVPMIMTAHILYPQIDPSGLPATLSPTFLKGLLRQEMNFDGLIITDCLDMRAIADRYGMGKAALMAFRAGADLAMVKGLTLAEQRAAFEETVLEAQTSGFNENENEKTLARLESWRKRFCLPVSSTAPSQAAYQLIANASKQSLTIVNAKKELLPIPKMTIKRPLLVDFTLAMASPVEEGRRPGSLLEQQLQQALPNLIRLELAAAPSQAEIERIRTWATQSDLLIIVTRQADRQPAQAALVRELLSANVPAIVIAAREPYDLALFPDAPVSILTYGDQPATIKALVNLLTADYSNARENVG